MMRADVAAVLAGLEPWALVHGDCLDAADGLASLPDNAAAHVICDPPYEVEAHTNARRTRATMDRTSVPYEIPFAPMNEADRDAVAVQMACAASGWLLAFCQVEAVDAWRKSFERACPKSWRRGMAWIKPDAMCQMTGDRPAQGFECIACAWVGAGRSKWNAGGKRGVYTYRVNVDLPGTRPHPTSKPIELMEALVRDFTRPGDLVLDPYAGSATTGVACLKLGRRFIGWEVDAKFAATARRRLTETREQPDLLAAEAFRFGAKGKRKQLGLTLDQPFEEVIDELGAEVQELQGDDHLAALGKGPNADADRP